MVQGLTLSSFRYTLGGTRSNSLFLQVYIGWYKVSHSLPQVYIGWYKDGESLDGGNRIETEDSVTEKTRVRKLVFKYPTDNDPGTLT